MARGPSGRGHVDERQASKGRRTLGCVLIQRGRGEKRHTPGTRNVPRRGRREIGEVEGVRRGWRSPRTILSIPSTPSRPKRLENAGQELAPASTAMVDRLLWRRRAFPSATLDKMRTELESSHSTRAQRPPSSSDFRSFPFRVAVEPIRWNHGTCDASSVGEERSNDDTSGPRPIRSVHVNSLPSALRKVPREGVDRVSRIMPWLVSVGLILAGVVFGLQSESRYSSRTLWGYALLGMMCLLLGSLFAFMIWWRDSAGPKGGHRHPME
jgi:hypothetical protein